MRTPPFSKEPTLAPAGNPVTAPAGCACANTCGAALAAAAAAPVGRTVRRLESIIGCLRCRYCKPPNSSLRLTSGEVVDRQPGERAHADHQRLFVDKEILAVIRRGVDGIPAPHSGVEEQARHFVQEEREILRRAGGSDDLD